MKKTMATPENALYAVHNLKNLVKIREDLLLGEADDQDWHLADWTLGSGAVPRNYYQEKWSNGFLQHFMTAEVEHIFT